MQTQHTPTPYARLGWAVITETLCGPYVDLSIDDTGETEVALYATSAEAADELDDWRDMASEAVEDGDLTDFDDDGCGLAYVGVDATGQPYELDARTGEAIRPLNRSDR